MKICFDSLRFSLFPSYAVRTLEDMEAEAAKMVGALTTTEFGCLLQRQADGRANRVYVGDLAVRSIISNATDDDAGTSKKSKRAVAKGVRAQAHRASKDTVDSDADNEDEEAGSDEDGGSRGYTRPVSEVERCSWFAALASVACEWALAISFARRGAS